MLRDDEDPGETFGFPTSYKVLIWVTAVGGAGLSAVATHASFNEPDPGERYAAMAVALSFGCLALGFLRMVVKILPEKIHTDDRAITHETSDGTLTTLPWDRVARVIDRPFLQCLELRGEDGLTTIRIENQLERFDRLREIVLERSAWEDLEPPDLPATFSPTAMIYVVVISILVFFGGLGLAFISGGHSFLGTILILCGFGSVFALHVCLAIRVDRSAITFRHLAGKRVIPIDQVEEVRMETTRPGHGNALSTVMIRSKDGKVDRIVGAQIRGGALGLYRALLTAMEFRSPQAPEEFD